MLDTALIQKNLYSKCVDSLDSLGKHGSVPLSKHGFRFHSSEIEILEHAYLRRRGRTPNRHECEQFAQAFNNSEPRRKKNTHGWQARWPQVNAKQIKVRPTHATSRCLRELGGIPNVYALYPCRRGLRTSGRRTSVRSS
eukprot:scaffold1220_cov376-Prasinococcus_capsulatus_cf.AAC.15